MKFYKTTLSNKRQRLELRTGHQNIEEQILYSYEEQKKEQHKKFHTIEIFLDGKLIFKSIKL